MIRNARPGRMVVASAPYDSPTGRIVWRGWEDVRLGRPFPRDFDKMEKSHQQAYESSRRIAASLLPHFKGKLPEWDDMRKAAGEIIGPLPASVIDHVNAENALSTLDTTKESQT